MVQELLKFKLRYCRPYLLVRWAGRDASGDTREPLDSLKDCAEAISAFERATGRMLSPQPCCHGPRCRRRPSPPRRRRRRRPFPRQVSPRTPRPPTTWAPRAWAGRSSTGGPTTGGSAAPWRASARAAPLPHISVLPGSAGKPPPGPCAGSQAVRRVRVPRRLAHHGPGSRCHDPYHCPRRVLCSANSAPGGINSVVFGIGPVRPGRKLVEITSPSP